jgi:hypothetical protein
MKKYTFLLVLLGAAFFSAPHAKALCPVTNPDCHVPPGPPPPPPLPQPRPNWPHKGDFLIRFTGFDVLNTRSRHEDTNTLWHSAHLVYPNGQDVEISAGSIPIGDVNNGYHAVRGAVIGPFWMDTEAPVNLRHRYLMVNGPSGATALTCGAS